MKKKIVVLLAALLVCLMVQPILAADGSTMTISTSGEAVKQGDTLQVTVSLSETANVTALGLAVKVDGAGLEVVEGSFALELANVKQSSFKYNKNANAYIANIQMDGAQTVSGTLFTFSVKVLDAAALNGKYTISGSPSLRVNNTNTDCSLNSSTVTVACDHSYGAWAKKDDNTHARTCAHCGKEETGSHDWKGEVTKVSGCTEPGEMTYTCTGCGATKTEAIQPSDHVWDSGTVTKAATCGATGEKTFACASCGTTKVETIPLSDKHTYGDWTKVDDATHTHTCSVCQKADTADHTWNEGEVTSKPTCTETGEKTFTCTGCGAAKVETVEKSDTHSYDDGCDAECNLCGHERTPEHKYLDIWSMDETGHWHPCKICWTRTDEDEHTPGPEATEWDDQVCTVCGYVIQEALGHTHRYEDTLTSDETGHWYPCAGCDEKKDFLEHSFEHNCDTTCDVCGYVREIRHDYSNRLSADATGHWNACTVCGEILEKQPHNPGPGATDTTDQTCLDCGFIIQVAHSHVHEASGDVLSGEAQHWYQCYCGQEFGHADHTWDQGAEDQEAGTVTYLCTVCGYSRVAPIQEETQPTEPAAPTGPEQTEPVQPGTTPADPDPTEPSDPGDAPTIAWWWFVIIGICVLLLGGVIFVIVGILTSRKKVGKYSS